MTNRALITGIGGQDGTYLSRLLLARDYEIYGIEPGPCDVVARIGAEHASRVHVVKADLTDMASVIDAVKASAPDEVYNFAAQSSVGSSWDEAIATTEVNAVGVLRILEALREYAPRARFFQASSAEMFGRAGDEALDETMPIHPRSPYAASKAYGFHITASYRESHGMHANNGILFNHESPLRGTQFVTRKITRTAALIKMGLADELRLGNLDAQRDWGFAGDYVEAMWLMLQRDEPGDYVVATGEVHTVREFCDAAFSHLGLDYEQYVTVDPAFFRPVDVKVFRGDSSKARMALGWAPKTTFTELVHMMVDADMAALATESAERPHSAPSRVPGASGE